MLTYISDIIPRIQNFSLKLENLTLLTNKHWVLICDIDKTKTVYIFRQNNELIISQNGKVEKANWDYLGNNTLLIDRKEESFLFKHVFFDENILALKVDGKDEYAFLVNENKFDGELYSSMKVFEFLNSKYIDNQVNIKYNINKENISYDRIPNYILSKIGENVSLFDSNTEEYSVKFEDGQKGQIFVKKNNKIAYFKNTNVWPTINYNYKNIDFCINGLYNFIKFDIIISEGLLKS